MQKAGTYVYSCSISMSKKAIFCNIINVFLSFYQFNVSFNVSNVSSFHFFQEGKTLSYWPLNNIRAGTKMFSFL